jgi:thiol:disulfide interchange protein DsbC
MRQVLLALSVCFLSTTALADDVEDVAKLLKEKFPKLQFEKVERAPVSGLYEIHAGANIIYTDRNVEHLIFGEIYDVKGKNLTADKRRALFKELVLRMSKEFPKDAIHIPGKRKPTVFLVVDTDCPYSRRELQYLLSKNVDIFLIFYGFHRESFAHATYVLNSRDKKGALQEVISGKLDGKGQELLKKIPEEKRKELGQRLSAWEKWCRKYGINGVPFAIVPERQLVVQGARIDQLDKLFPLDFSQIDLSKAAVVVGNGKGTKVVVVTDPTCPFCRKACNELRHYAKEGKATFYVYFLPVHGNKSMQYIADIMNAPKEKRAEILEKIFTGKWKPTGKPFSPQARAEFEENLKVVNLIGATATPTFVFPDGNRIAGARINLIAKLIEGER